MNDAIQDKEGVSRRDFLSLAAIGTTVLSFLAVLAGILRLIKPNVRYEESKTVKIGKPENFPVDEGLHAISSVCTHLGCLVAITENGFQCPCHGSKYSQDGKVIAGPAPRNLAWLDIRQEIDGTLVVDAGKEIKKGTVFQV